MNWVLASSSPRRAEILESLGIRAEVHGADVDESVRIGETPEAHVERLAREKARAVSRDFPDRWVVAGDTVVTLQDRIFGKPRDEVDAVSMLLQLQGRMHRVFSAVALVCPGTGEPEDQDNCAAESGLRAGVQVTEVTFRAFDRGLAEAYVRTGEPMDKAGAYGIQGKGAALVKEIRGDYSGVVGLAVPLLIRLMEEANCPYRFGHPARD